jgi:molecular chaperone GrpE
VKKPGDGHVQDARDGRVPDARTDEELNREAAYEQDAAETEAAGASDADASEAAGATALAERERDEFRDLLLRQTADFDNYRRRTERERQALEETAAFNVIHELLPLVDDLERALQADAGSEGAEAYRKGVELIHRQLLDILRRRGVRPIEALGAAFDPHYHQAVAHEPANGRTDGEIVEEFRRGYTLGDRLLRPSMVKVAKG